MANVLLFRDEKPSNLSFGTTTSRRCFPSDVPPSRFGNELNPISGAPNRGPGCYNIDEITNFVSVNDARPLSKKGYTFGARTSQRFHEHIDMLTPDPAKYQPDQTRLSRTAPAYRPFNSGTRRDQSTRPKGDDLTPGPGNYDSKLPKSRRVAYHQSFGGPPVDLPDVTQHSTIGPNTDKLHSTKEEKLYHRRLAYLKLYYS